MTMTLIQTVTLGSANGEMVFTNIPTTFTDLMLLVSARGTANGERQILFQFNADGSNHSTRRLFGTGSTVASQSQTNVSAIIAGFIPGADYTANTFASSSIYVPNYRSSTNKAVSVETVGENNATTANQLIVAGSYATTNPITVVALYLDSGLYAAGSTASLYGITKGSGGATVA